MKWIVKYEGQIEVTDWVLSRPDLDIDYLPMDPNCYVLSDSIYCKSYQFWGTDIDFLLKEGYKLITFDEFKNITKNN